MTVKYIYTTVMTVKYRYTFIIGGMTTPTKTRQSTVNTFVILTHIFLQDAQCQRYTIIAAIQYVHVIKK